MCEGADNPPGIKLGTEAMASYHLHYHFYTTPFARQHSFQSGLRAGLKGKHKRTMSSEERW